MIDIAADPVGHVTADPVDHVTADPADDDGAAEFADPFLAALDDMSAEEVLARAGVPPCFATLAYHGSADLPGEPGDGIDLADLIGDVPSDRKISCPFHADRSPSLHVYTDHSSASVAAPTATGGLADAGRRPGLRRGAAVLGLGTASRCPAPA